MKISATVLYQMYAHIWNLNRGFAMPAWGNLPTESKDGWTDMATALENWYSAVKHAPPSAYQPGSSLANAALKPGTASAAYDAKHGPDLETIALKALAIFGRHKPTCSPLGECECGFAAVEAGLAEELARARSAGGTE